MPTLSAFYDQITDELRRGTTFDSLRASKVRQAVRMIEDLHTFLHMEHFASLSIDPATANPRALSQPSSFKRMEFWRIIKPSDAGYRYLTKADPKDVDKTLTAMPNVFWLDGRDYFWLDNTPDQVYSSEMAYSAYSDLSEASPPVIQHLELAVLHATCVLFAPTLRDPKFYEMHKASRDDAIKAAIDADVEVRMSNESLSVQYGHEFVERVNQGL